MNRVLLLGNLTREPYFDIIPGSNLPFMRVQLAVRLPHDLADVLLLGNLTHDPYYAEVGPDKTPFLRFYLAVTRGSGGDGQRADFLRVVAYGDRALFDHAYLKAGSEVLVSGNLRARRYRAGGEERTCVEVVADPDEGITFLRKIDWEAGDAARERILAERGDEATGEARDRPYGGGVFRVVTYGTAACLNYPYLRQGAGIFVRGRLRSRKRDVGRRQVTVVEVVARDIKFLRGIDWESGDAARERLLGGGG